MFKLKINNFQLGFKLVQWPVTNHLLKHFYVFPINNKGGLAIKRIISLALFKKRLNKDKINNCHVWEEELPDGSYDMGFNGNFNHMEKRKSGYVTQKQFSEFKDANNQRLIKIETTLAIQGEQINKLTQTVEKQGEQINQLVQVVLLQGEQIRELQVEQKAQRQEFNARMDRLENLLVESIESTNKRFDSMERRLDSMDSRLDSMENRLDSMEGRLDSMENRLDSMEGRLDSVEGRLDSMETRLDSMETRLDKVDPPK
ncbi:DUF16 domain-containing protein [Mycoplasmoides pneumoniae]|uniref:DUF16 domain-containing protein n=3 Tax=Mycoplasmoides pneumoniae TaxID=2104 RepID=UPI0002B8464E|nr:DUF16 domain-containing protein [Mycoplasmoides pneumoniae]AGC04055.1 hypothetical protein C985_0127 [Mycoplasmoides pneumoniae M129-B7]ALA30011.1 hypothetical protein C897_00750 [Mycoplasmoides pneumoniae PI 1428]ALA32124.1 hypothetical protein F533_00755 [Mycoplasmoides pneumoniae 51494]ALA32826.1 hypothetical protein F530_00755 [Mycoplasmoides pneumoniae 54089]ALA33529.1 hypothetical protein F531_00755 [Mycoplasmoides pneumoniae 54524]